MENQNIRKDFLNDLFRKEYVKMTAVLCRHFGLKNISAAEDIVSETFLKASEYWAINGIPDNPTGWLYTVAANKTRDHLRRENTFVAKVRDSLQEGDDPAFSDLEFNDASIRDSQLAMMFAVCNPANSDESQICLALQILCGFSIREIATAFITKPETIKKRLLRARANLRDDNFRIESLSDRQIESRLDTVLRTLYLIFNEGYYSRTSNDPIRTDLCLEALHLALLLTQVSITNVPQVNALLALMCYQSSRFKARFNNQGEAVLFEDQDRSLWDDSLIHKGNFYLVNATNGCDISKYHLEAGIAYWHTTNDSNKWSRILQLYNQLVVIEYSPITALNRTFAYAKVYGKEQGIVEALKLNLDGNPYFHQLLGYLYADSQVDEAIKHYQSALVLSKSEGERKTIMREIQRLKT